MGSPLRILHVVVNMNRGGAETLIMNLYRNIDKTKVQFDFLTCKEGAFDAEIEELGGNIHRIPYISDVGHFKYVNELDQFFSTHHDYKIVHSHMDKMSGLVLRSAKKAGIPIRISHSHNTNSEGGFATKLYKWYAGNFILGNATDLFACSKKAGDWLFKGSPNSIQLIKNGIEINKFAFCKVTRKEIRDELKLNPDTFVLGHVGRFAPQKNHKFLIKLFAKFQETNKNSVLILVGEGPLRTEIQKQAAEFNLTDKVKFLGIRSDIHRLLQAFDLFMFPSLHEGLPVSLIEAQGAGLPCLISNNVSLEADIGCQLASFISLQDEAEWLKKMVSIAKKPVSREIIADSLAKQGYDIRETAEYLEEFYLGSSG